MKRGTRILLVIVFFAFIAAGLVTHVCLTCYPDHQYLARVEQAFLASAEGGQVDEPIVTAWAQSQSPD
ncbi:MAG TPA: hypothetical protein VMT71_03830 [Syntrophorhabdales bacterium]|nr:hypothetical protein [Syntrophorhabdales bacterium]